MLSRNTATSCPSDSELLRSTSGDLSARRAERVRAHLQECDRCRSRVHGWNTALEAYSTYTEDEHSATPRLSTFQHALLAEDDARRQRTMVLRRRWSSLAAVAATILVAVVWYMQAEVRLDAEEVITRAADFEHRRSVRPAAAVRIRRAGTSNQAPATTGPQGRAGNTREIAFDSGPLLERPSKEAAAARDLGERLVVYGFNWQNPMSAQQFGRWRQTARARHDRVEWLNGGLIKVSTVAEGLISEAELVVRNHTYEPVTQRWCFADGLILELSTLPDDLIAARTPLATKVLAPTAETTATTPTDAPPGLDAIELDLRVALHQFGAPVGHTVSVRRIRGRIRLEGTVPSRDAVTNIVNYARDHDLVETRVRYQETVWPQSIPRSRALNAWLERTFADEERRSSFARSTAALEDAVRASAATLADLALRYATEPPHDLHVAARRKLTELANAEYRDLVDAYDALEAHIAPLIGTISRPVFPEVLPADWRHRGPAAIEASAQVKSAFDMLCAGQNPDPEPFVAAGRQSLRPALEQLAAAVAGSSLAIGR
jgi:hypothetical protein